jgi:hypothetical protein
MKGQASEVTQKNSARRHKKTHQFKIISRMEGPDYPGFNTNHVMATQVHVLVKYMARYFINWS